ncbi:pyridoxamine 5'-phosphate oxidase family protein [Cognatiyoonia sp. IB215182]|uniref:pyridoxamine 5'-phosphate oxidase family protein n=1 Tax=Cognatiyoonia sp. IB215182 TaxID=3097353 RepID=UPI002A141336|nr:pyridoxamine 5'-phosphate oxidase family protein [Cognatiyoonia sp. IB215182]MDX8352677.1 pyridoxamine 5'-phosphate oxidase family protein [Cognatiyoonia sp. IB215182]
MSQYPLDPAYLINDEEALRALFPQVTPIAAKKSVKQLDKHARELIARAPFLCIGTQRPDEQADVSPRGDAPGFVQVLDETTLLIPDRPGNNRLDTQANILANPAVGLLFIIPGFDETLRVNGTARITRDPKLLADSAVNGRVPLTAIIVSIEEIFIHCAKAFRRSKLWDPSQHQDRREMPSLIEIVLDQTSGRPDDPDEMRRLNDRLEETYRTKLY